MKCAIIEYYKTITLHLHFFYLLKKTINKTYTDFLCLKVSRKKTFKQTSVKVSHTIQLLDKSKNNKRSVIQPTKNPPKLPLTDAKVGNEAVTKGASIKTGFCPRLINIRIKPLVRESILYHGIS